MDESALVGLTNFKQNDSSSDKISAKESLINKLKGSRLVVCKELLNAFSKCDIIPNDAQLINMDFKEDSKPDPTTVRTNDKTKMVEEVFTDPILQYEVVPNIESNQSKRMTTRCRKLLALRTYLEKDFKAAELKWSLFVAASHSHRYDEILEPFPPDYVRENDEKNIESLIKVIENTPPLPLILQEVYNPNACQVNDQVINLLTWLFISVTTPYLETLDKTTFMSILNRAHCEMPILKPDYIFRVVSYNETKPDIVWEKLTKRCSTIFAFHGSKLENFYSILHKGLHQHIRKDFPDKNRVFGKGIYLSKENLMSLKYSPCGHAWGGHQYASEICCVALCEFADIKNNYVQLEGSTSVDFETDMEITNKYYVLTNSDMVRVRYLLIYCKPRSQRQLERGSLFDWVRSHLLLVCLLGFGILALVIEIFYNSSVVRELLGL